jgi:hypothetical protein
MRIISKLTSIYYPILNHYPTLVSNSAIITKILMEEYPGKNIHAIGMGTSGAVMIAMLLPHVKSCVVKKPEEKCHRAPISYVKPLEIGMIIDDFMSTGRTIETIGHQLNTYTPEVIDKIQIAALGEANTHTLVRLFPNLKLIITT